MLFAIASTIGIPMHLDAATDQLRKPSVARIQIEVNLLKERPDSIWIGLGEEEGFWQPIKYCNVPYYCSFCCHVGHSIEQYHIKNPALKQFRPEAPENGKEQGTKRGTYVYRAKEKRDITAGGPSEVFAQPQTQMQQDHEMASPRQLKSGPQTVNADQTSGETTLQNMSKNTEATNED